jgi:hypothetical protein
MPGIAPGQHGTPSPGQAAPPSIVLFPTTLQGRIARARAPAQKARSSPGDARPRYQVTPHSFTRRGGDARFNPVPRCAPGAQVRACTHHQASTRTSAPGQAHQASTRPAPGQAHQASTRPAPGQAHQASARAPPRCTPAPGTADHQGRRARATRCAPRRHQAHAGPGAGM